MTAAGPKSHLFVSYARRDSKVADSLQTRLRQRGIEVWVDRSRLVPGAAWPEGLRRAVESCDAMLVLISPASLASEFVRREYLHALSLGKAVIPLVITPVWAFPEELRDVQWVDLQQKADQGYFDLLLALDAHGWPLANANALDWEMTLARASRLQLPDGWHVYRVQDRRWYQKPALLYLETCVLAVAVIAALVDVGAIVMRVLGVGGGFALLAVLAILCGLLIPTAVILGIRGAQWRHYWAGKGVPEVIVATPTGVVIRSLGFPRGTKVRAYPFQGASRLSYVPRRDRHSVRLTLSFAPSPLTLHAIIPRRYTDAGAIASQLVGDFRRYLEAHGIVPKDFSHA